jgi:hypothetical protein
MEAFSNNLNIFVIFLKSRSFTEKKKLSELNEKTYVYIASVIIVLTTVQSHCSYLLYPKFNQCHVFFSVNSIICSPIKFIFCCKIFKLKIMVKISRLPVR